MVRGRDKSRVICPTRAIIVLMAAGFHLRADETILGGEHHCPLRLAASHTLHEGWLGTGAVVQHGVVERGTALLPLGVTGNTPDSGSGESWFEPRRGNSNRDARLSRV